MDGDNAARMVADSGGGDPFEDDSSILSDDSFHEENYPPSLKDIKKNVSWMIEFNANGNYRDVTSKAWARIGRIISNNTQLQYLHLRQSAALNDEKMQSFFQGLMRSRKIKDVRLSRNTFGVAVVRSMVPFLQNTDNLTCLVLDNNNIQSEGFNILFRALSDSPIETLNCSSCGIESIDIHSNHIPRHLIRLYLHGNRIRSDGCRELAKLLQGGDSTLKDLVVSDCKIDDDGVEILIDALQNNKSLKKLDLGGNKDISNQGLVMLLKLVNDISSITATLQSNHTLENLYVYWSEPDEINVAYYQQRYKIQQHIIRATAKNKIVGGNPQAVGREKVIQFQLHSENRAELAALQEIEHSVYSEIDPLHLPEVLSLLSRRPYAQGELFGALRSTVVGLFSMVNMRQCIKSETASRAAKIDEYKAMISEHGTRLKDLNARLETMDGSNQGKAEDVEVHKRSGGNENKTELEHRSTKRRRKWWWGFWDKAE